MNELKPLITYDDFSKLDIRVGTIKSCENVEGSEKLLKLTVDFGPLGERQILTGMAKFYQPEQLLNLQTFFVLNLEPRKMMGLESQGMILGVGLGAEKPSFLIPQITVENGDGVR